MDDKETASHVSVKRDKCILANKFGKEIYISRNAEQFLLRILVLTYPKSSWSALSDVKTLNCLLWHGNQGLANCPAYSKLRVHERAFGFKLSINVYYAFQIFVKVYQLLGLMIEISESVEEKGSYWVPHHGIYKG